MFHHFSVIYFKLCLQDFKLRLQDFKLRLQDFKLCLQVFKFCLNLNGSGNKRLLVGRLEFKLKVFWVHKDMSNSYREGTAPKLKSMAQPYKMKVLKKT